MYRYMLFLSTSPEPISPVDTELRWRGKSSIGNLSLAGLQCKSNSSQIQSKIKPGMFLQIHSRGLTYSLWAHHMCKDKIKTLPKHCCHLGERQQKYQLRLVQAAEILVSSSSSRLRWATNFKTHMPIPQLVLLKLPQILSDKWPLASTTLQPTTTQCY